MIRSTKLILTESEKLAERQRAAERVRRNAIAEYALLLVMVALCASVNYLNMRSDDQDQARAFAARYVRQGPPKPPYIISTPMRKETILVGSVKVERQWYFNDDATMRYVDSVPEESAQQVGYLKNDVVYSHDRRRKVWQRTDVPTGDSGKPASYVSFQFDYKSDSDYSVTVVSATPGGWRWTHHKDTFENEQLASQVIYERSGQSTRRTFAVSKAQPVTPDDDAPEPSPARTGQTGERSAAALGSAAK